MFEDELLAPLADGLHSAASRFWMPLAATEDGPALPKGAHPLAEAVVAPLALARSLAQAGWVENEEAGRHLQARLAPGQRLADREGRLWRWDGFTSIRSAPSPAAEQLRHRNRLAALEEQITAAEAAGLIAARRASTARAERHQASEADRLARQHLRDAEAPLARARAAEAELSRRALTTETRLAAAVEIFAKIDADLTEVEAQADEAKREHVVLPDPAAARAELEAARAAAGEARRRDAEARAEIDRLSHEAARRRER